MRVTRISYGVSEPEESGTTCHLVIDAKLDKDEDLEIALRKLKYYVHDNVNARNSLSYLEGKLETAKDNLRRIKSTFEKLEDSWRNVSKVCKTHGVDVPILHFPSIEELDETYGQYVVSIQDIPI